MSGTARVLAHGVCLLSPWPFAPVGTAEMGFIVRAEIPAQVPQEALFVGRHIIGRSVSGNSVHKQMGVCRRTYRTQVHSHIYHLISKLAVEVVRGQRGPTAGESSVVCQRSLISRAPTASGQPLWFTCDGQGQVPVCHMAPEVC